MSLELFPRPVTRNRGKRSTVSRLVMIDKRTDAVVVLREASDASTNLGNSLFWALRCRTGEVVVDLAEAKSIDVPSIQILAKAQRLLNSQGRKLTFRSPSQLDTLVWDLYRSTAK